MRETLALQPQRMVVDETPVQFYIDQIVARLRTARRLPFSALFTPPCDRNRLVGLFLAILELIKDQQLVAEQTEAFGEIWVCLVSQSTTVVETLPSSA